MIAARLSKAGEPTMAFLRRAASPAARSCSAPLAFTHQCRLPDGVGFGIDASGRPDVSGLAHLAIAPDGGAQHEELMTSLWDATVNTNPSLDILAIAAVEASEIA
jgi:hypothetical protein